MKNEHGLTHQQEAFVSAMNSGKSGAEAYGCAYPKSRKWQEQSRRIAAAKLLAITNVSQRLRAQQVEASDDAILKLKDVLEETRRLMASNIGNTIDRETGKVLLPHELDAATAAAVSSFEIDDMGRVKYRFWDKNSSLERAAKILGAFEKDNKQKAAPVAELLASLTGNVFRPAAEAAQPDDDDAP